VRLGLLVLLILAVVGSTAVHAQNVAARIGDTIDGLSDTVAATFARSVPLPSASAGVQYVFDPATGNFQRSPTTFGQVYLDRADPLGKGQMNVSVSYAYLELDTVDGKPANDLRDSAPIPAAGKQAALTIPSFGVRAAVHQMLLAFTYGFTDDLEAQYWYSSNGVRMVCAHPAVIEGAARQSRGVSMKDGWAVAALSAHSCHSRADGRAHRKCGSEGV